MTKGIGALAAILALVSSAACTVQQADSAPPLTGPSGLAQTITVTATPDVITRDGFSQSAIVVRVANAAGEPAAAVPVRVDILDATGTPVDFGTLSTKQIVTGADGRATTVYTAPPPPPSTAGGFTTVATIRAIALGSDAQNSKEFYADIRLVPPGVILPPAGTPTAAFSTSPTNLLAGLPVNFDASASQAGTGASAITSYAWSFGDGSSGAGRTTTHTYAGANTFNVTLTVTNDRGISSSLTQSITVGTGVLPTPNFNFSPAAPGVGELVFFNASATSAAPGRTIASYRWAFGDGATASGVTASHAYSTAGTYTVTLTVTDDLGGSVTTTQSVSPGNPPSPTARFTVSPTQPAVGQQVLFSASTSTTPQGQTITDYFWNFGDNPSCPPVTNGVPTTCYQQTTSPTITHTFTQAGTYNVNLTVRDSAGRTGSTSASVTVSLVGSSAPTPSFTFSPSQPSVGENVFFNASASSASSGRTITAYNWTFGDGTTATGVTASHAYSVAGTYSVQLRVTDDAGQSTTSAAQPVTVASRPAPTPVFTFSPSQPGIGETVFFNASNSTAGPGRTITAYSWTFGDGGTATSVTTSHAYTAAGSYAVQLRVTDDAGQSTTSASQTVTVGNPPAPTARFTFSPTNPVVAQSVVFDAATSTPGGQGATIVSYAWNFGDGTPITSCPGDAACGSTNRTISHTFATAQTYTVNLVVTDSAGRTGAASATVQVATASPTARLTVAKTGTLTVSADASSSTATGTNTITNYSFTWGDGTAATSGTASSASHTYLAVGTYQVVVTVTDSAGRTSSASASVTFP